MKKRNIILVLLTLGGVATVFAMVISNTITTKNMRELAISSSNQVSLPTPEKKETKDSSPTADPTKAPTPTPTPTATAAAKIIESTPEPKETPEPKLTFNPPVHGDVIGRFSTELLVFSEVYNDYRTHMGIDILGDSNTPVMAIADGIVSQNYFDYDEGIIIEIEHKDGYVSIYKNLGNAKMAAVGKVVKQGEAISSIGDTGIFESNMPYHVHLEMKKDGEYIDPLSVISVFDTLSRDNI